jgi:hypothetical protein
MNMGRELLEEDDFSKFQTRTKRVERLLHCLDGDLHETHKLAKNNSRAALQANKQSDSTNGGRSLVYFKKTRESEYKPTIVPLFATFPALDRALANTTFPKEPSPTSFTTSYRSDNEATFE